MKSSLFRDRPARKTRMTMMVSGAVLIHTAFVGVGALWQEPVTVRKNIEPYIDIGDPVPDPDAGGIHDLPVANTEPTGTPESSTPAPQIPVVSDPLPPKVFLEMAEPGDATPPPRPRRTVSRPGNPSAVASHGQTSVGASGVRGANSVGTAGVPGNGIASIQGWKMPKPPYPRTVMIAGLQGATTVRITTDASGNVATVEIMKSAGNLLLDHNTQIYVREFWKGPPNASRTTEVVYQIR